MAAGSENYYLHRSSEVQAGMEPRFHMESNGHSTAHRTRFLFPPKSRKILFWQPFTAMGTFSSGLFRLLKSSSDPMKKYTREFLRFLAALQLLPALESGEETLVGGQAVMEGVMMRSPHAWGIAVRKPNGEITTHCETLERPSEKHKWLGWPFVRGLATLGQAMRLGFVASKFSLNVGLEEIAKEEGEKKPEIGTWAIVGSMIVSIGFFIVMYKLVPLGITKGLSEHWAGLSNNFVFTAIEGLIRIAIFLAFIWGISLWADIKRVYRYHGAEHKTVFAFEDHGMPSIAEAQKYSTYHPRC